MDAPIENMLNELEAEARESGQKMLDDAHAQAKEIINKAEEEGEKLAAKSLEGRKKELGVEKSRRLSNANFFVKKETIKAKEEVINKLFVKLEQKIGKDLSSNSSEAVISKLTDEALSKFESQKVKVLVNDRDKDFVEKALSKTNVEYSISNSLDGIGGLKVEFDEGRIVVDNTIDSRLQKMRQTYEPDIISLLFGEEK